MKATTSRDRFDERKRFSGVFQQMGRVALDSDWNEQVHIRTADARRRTQDVAHGSPDVGGQARGVGVRWGHVWVPQSAEGTEGEQRGHGGAQVGA